MAVEMFDQPFDGVVGVGAFVGVLAGFFVVQVRGHVGEFAFRQVAPAHVLIGENVSFFGELDIGADAAGIFVRAVRPATVWRAKKQNGIFSLA